MRVRDKEFNDYFIWRKISNRLPCRLGKALKRKLQMLKTAATINDLRIPPSNHLELLKGKLAGYYSIRVNAQYRLIFHWSQQQQEAYDVHH